MRKNVKNLLLAVIVLAALVLLFLYPKEIQKGIGEGLKLCGEIIIPALFPFMALAGFISRTGAARLLAIPFESVMSPLFRLPKEAGGTVLLSLIGGYPVGASSVAMLCAQGYVDRKDSSRMLTFCANAGPAMVVIAIGKGLLGNIYVGWIIYLSHIAAAIVTGWCFARFAPKPSKNKSARYHKGQSLPDAFVGAVSDGALQMLTVCGYVVLFSGVNSLFKLWGAEWISAFTEVTCGTKWAALSGLSAPIICGILSFGGFSVMCQISSLSHGLISFKQLIISRIVNALLGFVICSAAIKTLPQSLQVLSNIGEKSVWISELSIPLSVSMLVMAAVFLCSVGCKEKVLQK
ncbi:MAG: hypothetical protein IJF58_03870 [Clostridia bacterium]|nr:hypothetical protein [Clostridia bacterium]